MIYSPVIFVFWQLISCGDLVVLRFTHLMYKLWIMEILLEYLWTFDPSSKTVKFDIFYTSIYSIHIVHNKATHACFHEKSAKTCGHTPKYYHNLLLKNGHHIILYMPAAPATIAKLVRTPSKAPKTAAFLMSSSLALSSCSSSSMGLISRRQPQAQQ